MKATAKTSFLLLASKKKRTLSFILLIALLSLTAGLLGHTLLTKKDAVDPIALAIVDHEDSTESRLLFDTLMTAAKDKSHLDIKKTTQATAKTLLENGEVSAVFVIPEDFFDSIIKGINRPLQVAYNPHTPLQSSLLEMYVNQILEVLKASQVGIYTTLDYTETFHPEDYNALFLAINARYISTALFHNKMVAATEVLPTGSSDSFSYFLFSALLFLLLLGGCLYLPLLRENFAPSVIFRLQQQNHSMFPFALGTVLGWWGWYSLVGCIIFAAYTIAAKSLGLAFHWLLFPGLLLFLFFVSAFGVLVAFLFSKPLYGTFFLSAYALMSLVFSGGIIPLSYVPSFAKKISLLFPSTWARSLLQSNLEGNFPLLPAAMLLLFSFACILLCSFRLSFGPQEVSK